MNLLAQKNLFNFSLDSLIENISLDDMFNHNPEIGTSNLESFKYDKNPMENISELFKQNTIDSEKRVDNKNVTFKTEKVFINQKRGRKTV